MLKNSPTRLVNRSYWPLLVKWRVGVEKLASKTRFPSGEFLPIRVFLLVSGCLRACHRWLRSHVEEPHQSFQVPQHEDRKSTRLNSSHRTISYAVFCLKKKNKNRKNVVI